MRRIAALILAFCLCSTLCACNTEQESKETMPTETVFWHDLFDPDANIAAVQQYVGKEATVIGRISEINVDCCKMDTFYSSKKTATIYMETSILAKLQVGQFQAITGIVTAAEEDNYNITATEIGDDATQREIFETNIEELFSLWFWLDGLEEYNPYIVCEYVRLYWDECRISTNSQLRTALEGRWNAYHVYEHEPCDWYGWDVVFNKNGNIDSDSYYKSEHNKYRVQNGKLEYTSDESKYSYKDYYVYMLDEKYLMVYRSSWTILEKRLY